jgi:hypothetical protein
MDSSFNLDIITDFSFAQLIDDKIDIFVGSSTIASLGDAWRWGVSSKT